MNIEEHKHLCKYHYNQDIEYFLILKVFSCPLLVSPLPHMQPMAIINNYFIYIFSYGKGQRKVK